MSAVQGQTESTTGSEYPESNAASTRESDRRRSKREAFLASAWVSAEPGTRGASRQVVVIDLSLNGVGFSSDEHFDAGSIHWIVLGAGGLRASSRMRIISCRQRDDGAYDCGAEFF